MEDLEDDKTPSFSLKDFKKWLSQHELPEMENVFNLEEQKENLRKRFKKRFRKRRQDD